MRAPNRRRGPGRRPGPFLLPVVMIGLFTTTCVVWGCLWLAGRLSGTDYLGDRDPVRTASDLVSGELAWPLAGTLVAAGLAVALTAAAVAIGHARRRRRRRRTRVDVAAQHMGRGQQIEVLSVAAARETAKRLDRKSVV